MKLFAGQTWDWGGEATGSQLKTGVILFHGAPRAFLQLDIGSGRCNWTCSAMVSWSLAAAAAVVAGIVLLLYNQYALHQKDIHEVALNQQASISPSRKEDETAVYRNNQTPHGLPLLTGLQIRQGFRLRNGNLRDIWSVVMDQKNKEARFSFISANGEIVCDVDNINAVLKRLINYFLSNSCTKIGIAVPVHSFHGFVAVMACWVGGLTAHTFNQLPRTQFDIDLLVVDESQLQYAKMFKYKEILVVSNDGSKTFDGDEACVNWREIGDLETLSDPVFQYKYDPSYDTVLPLIDTHNSQTTSYTQQNFVSSIGAIIRALPMGHELGQERLLIGYEGSTINYWPKVLATLLYGGSVMLGNDKDATFTNAIVGSRPTTLAIDAHFAKKYFLPKTDYGFIQSLKLSRVMNLLSQGVFSLGASLPGYDGLRLIYIGDEGKGLSSEELTTIRALYGCRVISERFKVGTIGSVLSTNFFDYRIFGNKRLMNRGTSPLSLEAKLFRFKDYDISKRHGELCIRGFTIGKPDGETELQKAIAAGERVGSEGWMPTGIIGKFGADGCFYEG